MFASPAKPGPKGAPAKDRARARVVELRRQGLSVYEISSRLRAEAEHARGQRASRRLRRSGLVTSWRAGRRVLYQRTALATSVIAAGDGWPARAAPEASPN